jgi:hypothetical protein
LECIFAASAGDGDEINAIALKKAVQIASKLLQCCRICKDRAVISNQFMKELLVKFSRILNALCVQCFVTVLRIVEGSSVAGENLGKLST